MKKFFLLSIVIFTISFLVACSSKRNSTVEISINSQENVKEGRISEIKDFMFVITDENDEEYAFSFNKRPEDLDNIKDGDNVRVTYTGELTVVDTFVGEIISIEKIK